MIAAPHSSWYRLTALALGTAGGEAATLSPAQNLPVHIGIDGWNQIDFASWDIDGDGIADIFPAATAISGPTNSGFTSDTGAQVYLGVGGVPGTSQTQGWQVHFLLSGGGQLPDLAPGIAIGPQIPFARDFLGGAYKFSGFGVNVYYANPPGEPPLQGNRFGFESAGEALIGFDFLRDGQRHYGWARMSYNFEFNPFDHSLTITEAWYNNTPGGEILAAQVPEPSPLGLLALGAAGVLTQRRRRRREPSMNRDSPFALGMLFPSPTPSRSLPSEPPEC